MLNKSRYRRYISKEIPRRNHITVVISTDGTIGSDVIAEEIKTAVHKMNRRLKKKFTLDICC